MKLALSLRSVTASRFLRFRWMAPGVVAVLAGSLVGWHAGGRARAAGGPDGAPKLARVQGGAPGVGVTSVDAGGQRTPLTEGANVPFGATFETDGRTRARLEMPGGSVL